METYYSWWVGEEKKKIHNEFEERRQQIHGKMFLAGMEGKSKNDIDCEAVSSELKNLDAQEQELIDSFEADPQATTLRFMEYTKNNQSNGKK